MCLSWLCVLDIKVVTDLAIHLAKNSLPGLVSNLASNAASNPINKFERRIHGKGVIRAEKGFTFSIFDKDMDDIIEIIKLLEDSGVLIDGVTEAVKHETKMNILVLC